MSNLIVSKFGGNSVATAESIKKAAEIIKSDPARRYIVISAPGRRSHEDIKVTDMLFMCHAMFSNKEKSYDDMAKKIADRYQEIVDGLGINFDLEAELSDFKKSLVLGRNADYSVSRGEYVMAKIFAQYIGWPFVDAADLIYFKTDGTLDEDRTLKEAAEVLSKYEHAVIPGFYGSIGGINIKLFSRGGADITGAILARALNADFCEKWSEATQIFSADPTIVENPEIIRNITYQELRELTYMGINVIDEDVIFLLQQVKIPIRIRNINYPDDIGTFVSDEIPGDAARNIAACIAGLRHYRFIHIEKFGLNKTKGIGMKVFQIFTNRNISCEHYISGIYNFAIVVKNPMFDLKRNEILQEIRDAIHPESINVESDLSLIAIIGKGMGTVKGIFARVFDAIAAVDVKVRMINQGADDLNIIIGVHDKDFDTTVRALYNAMILN
ncbi:MAG: aspartate kinase [Synergistaceae bacterium]|nr:aspartate kinase [Synergistaceae bacterium]